MIDLRFGQTETIGRVSTKIVEKGFFIWVAEQEFNVSREIFNYVSEDDGVVVSHWPRSKVVSRVDKVNSTAAYDQGRVA